MVFSISILWDVPPLSFTDNPPSHRASLPPPNDAKNSPPAVSFADQASDILEQLWPVILVVSVMIALQWLVSFQFGREKASSYVLPGYLALAMAFSVKHLHGEGHIEKVCTVTVVP